MPDVCTGLILYPRATHLPFRLPERLFERRVRGLLGTVSFETYKDIACAGARIHRRTGEGRIKEASEPLKQRTKILVTNLVHCPPSFIVSGLSGVAF